MKLNKISLIALQIFILFNCSSDHNTPTTLFQLKPSSETGINFSNRLFETTELNIITFEYLYNGAGVAIGDINQDGLQDIYFSGNMVEGKLYLNKGNFEFEDITEKAGISTKNKWGTGVSMADVNGDGLLDLYLCFSGPYDARRRENLLYINNGDLTFSERGKAFGLNDSGHTTHAAFFDYDKDGDLDAYLLTNITDETGPNIIRPKRNNGEMLNTDRLYRNDNGKFTNVSSAAGILKEGYGLGVAIGDINQDHWPDIYVSNDYLSNDLLYLNNQDGTFSEVAAATFDHTSYSSMGCDLADYNNDGLPDIIAVDMLPPDQKRRKLMMGTSNYNRFYSEIKTGYFPQYMRNTLQLNQPTTNASTPAFSEIGQLANIQSTDWSWSPLMMDIDNDGWKDLLITNGYPRDITNLDFAAYKANLMMNRQYNQEVMLDLIREVNQIEGAYLPNYGFQNQGDLTFKDQSQTWGLTQPSFSHGAAVGDLDNDGDLDYVTNNTFDEVFIYENTTQENNFLRLELIGDNQNQFALGTKVWLYHKGHAQYLEHSPYRGFQSTIEPILHFGLGDSEIVDSLIILWPDLTKTIIATPAINQQLSIEKSKTQQAQHFPTAIASQTLLRSNSQIGIETFTHTEPHFIDFNYNPLIPHKYSQHGPKISTGDVNGDELTDFYISGAFRQTGQLFLQQPNGTFKAIDLTGNQPDFEEVDHTFFDAEGDGDLDLYIVSGSTEFPKESAYYQDRLFLNDGRGGFRIQENALPNFSTSKSCVAASDYDHDGDIDLFVGGYVHLNEYPFGSQSYILDNQDGRFTVSEQANLFPANQIGIVKDAAWADLNQDGWEDLIVVGEWLPIKIFINQNGTLIDQTNQFSLGETIGWWNTIHPSDIDLDGDIDLVAGNLGLNTPNRHAQAEPFSLFVGDYDQNQQPDGILVHYLQQKQVPVHFRDDLLNWILPLKKRFADYESYATANWQDIFPNQKDTSIQINDFESAWFENLGENGFKKHLLPIEAQFAPIFGIQSHDLNGDNIPDLLLTGNSTSTDPSVGHYDALKGVVLIGKRDGTFTPLNNKQSGFWITGEGRDIATIKRQANDLILTAQNNGTIKAFSTKTKPIVQ